MKKHQPSLSPSVKELIALYEKAAAEVTNQPLPSTPSAQQRQESSSSSKAKGQKQSIPTTLDDLVDATVTSSPTTASLSRYAARMPSQTIYTPVAPRSGLSPIAEENEQTRPVAREEQMPAATAASPRTRLVLSEEQITALLKNSRLVREYEEEIQTFCQKVYGNPDALQKQLEQIQKDPSRGEGLSTQMNAAPEGLHKLAGKKMLGIKSNARRAAHENLPTLCGLVDSYVAAVKIVREDLSMTPEAVLPYYEEAMGKEAVDRILQNPHSSERSSASLSNDDISERTRQHPMVKRHHTQITYWCDVVFGNSDLFKQQTEAIFENPALVEELTWSIAESPQSFGHYAGVGVGNLKNRARRHAEAGLSHLISAMGNYANTVQSVREGLTQSQQQQTAQQQHEQTAQTSQTLQRQQEFLRSPQLSHSAKPPESLAATSHQETAGSSRHTQEPAQDVRPRRTTSSRGMAFAS